MRPAGDIYTGAMERAQRTMAVLALSCLLVLGASRFIDFDCWHEMALARETLALRYVPLVDHFAYTPTVYPVIRHEWGTGMVMYALVTHGGFQAVLVAQWTLVLLVGTTCWRVARRHASPGIASALAPTAIIMVWAGFTAIRGLLFTLVFVAVLLAALERDREGHREWIVWWLPLHVIWVNLHAGFVVGLGLLVLHTIEQAARGRRVGHLVGVILATVALVTVNPYGIAYYPHLWRGLTFDRALIGEWAPLWRAGAPSGLMVYATSILVALYALLKNGPAASPGWPLVAVVAAAALLHQRHVSLHAVVWFCLVPGWVEASQFGAIVRSFWERRRLALAVCGAAFVLALAADIRHRVWMLDVPANPGDHPEVVYPVGAVDYLRAQSVAGNLLVPFEYGAYVSWMLQPKVKVSLDSRFEEAYPPGLLEEHIEFYAASPGWHSILDRYPTDAVLVRRGEPVEAALAAEPAWPRAYEDDAYAIFARRSMRLPFVDRRGERLAGGF